MRKHYFVLFAVLFLFASCNSTEQAEVPDFVAKQYKGDTVKLKDISRNKVTFLNVWSTFCGPCLAESQSLHRIYSKYKENRKFTFITIALNTENELAQFEKSRDTTNPYVQNFRLSKLKSFYIPTLIGLDSGNKVLKMGELYAAAPKDENEVQRIYKHFNIVAIPTTIIYDTNGRIVYKATGAETSDEGLETFEQMMYKKIDSLLLL